MKKYPYDRNRVLPSKREPLQAHEFTRGHPLIYKRWANREAIGANLPFPDLPAGKQNVLPIGKFDAVHAGGKSGVYTGDWE